MAKIHESGVEFGDFAPENLFHVEKSSLLSMLGEGIKTVEFVTLKGSEILFVEAKTGCPNPAIKNHGGLDQDSFEKYYDDITEKFMDSFQIFLKGYTRRTGVVEEIGKNLLEAKPLSSYVISFLLVITADEIQEDWLPPPKEELENRLKKIIKIWDVRIKVLNKELASRYGLVV